MFRSPRILKWLYPDRIWGISVSDRSVFLTFDDGPDAGITPWVLDFLKQERIVATFFCVGSNTLRNPELYERITREGHCVGNHTMNHENGYHHSVEDYLHSIQEAKQVIASRLFRPPYGRMKRRAGRKLKQDWKIIMWSWLSYDYNSKVSVSRIRSAAKFIQAGDILVFHDNRKTQDRLKELLPAVVTDLKERGFIFRTLSV